MNRYVRRGIAALEIGGGFAGIALTSSSAISLAPHWWNVVRVGAIGIPFALSVHAGVQLWRDQRSGYLWSFLIQLLQVPTLYSTAFLYRFYVGGTVGLIFPSMRPFAGFGSHLTLHWGHRPVVAEVGINFLAAWAAWQILKALAASRAPRLGEAEAGAGSSGASA